MTSSKLSPMDASLIEKRRMKLLEELDRHHPLAIFQELATDTSVAFILSDYALAIIKRGLSQRQRRVQESSALITVKVAALTPDKESTVYEISRFEFEHTGTSTAVVVERERLNGGEIEAHTHVYPTPDYLGKTDVGDLIASVEGPAWVHPMNNVMNPALRIFAILSIYRHRVASLQFYRHDLRENLDVSNAFGLKKLGNALVIENAF